MALPGQEDIDITLKMGSDNQHVVGGGLRQGVRVGGNEDGGPPPSSIVRGGYADGRG